ncbi:MAG: hypothetical protein AAFV46_00005, partial [Cyanobacteria bacterium J06635_11]
HTMPVDPKLLQKYIAQRQAHSGGDIPYAQMAPEQDQVFRDNFRQMFGMGLEPLGPGGGEGYALNMGYSEDPVQELVEVGPQDMGPLMEDLSQTPAYDDFLNTLTEEEWLRLMEATGGRGY